MFRRQKISNGLIVDKAIVKSDLRSTLLFVLDGRCPAPARHITIRVPCDQELSIWERMTRFFVAQSHILKHDSVYLPTVPDEDFGDDLARRKIGWPLAVGST